MTKKAIISLIIGAVLSGILHAQTAPNEIKVLAWNIWGKLNQAKKYDFEGKSARTRTIEILKDSQADIICMVETYGSAADIGKALGYHYYTPNPKANLCIFSKYKLTHFGNLKGLSSFSHIKATAHLSENMQVKIHCMWLTSGGRHIVEIKNQKLSDQDFVKGDTNRANMMKAFLNHQEVKADLNNAATVPIIIAGDLNCVSHLDYQIATKHLTHGRAFPSSPTHEMMLKKGFIDTYRHLHPAITKQTLGYTWTTVGTDYIYKSGEGFIPQDPKTHPWPQRQGGFARIDFIYSKGKKLKPIKSRVIKHYKHHTKRSFPEFPSDHAGVLTTFQIGK